MPEKLFVLGLPGSGKSAIARSIADYMSRLQVGEQIDKTWSTLRFNDYTILLDLFHHDTEGKQFKPAIPSGFDVIDLNVFDGALQALEQKVNAHFNSLKPDAKKLIIIEFSRNDYHHAFQQFNRPFLTDAYFLYLHAEVDVCKKRISQRIANRHFGEDDHPVSDYIFENYYYGDDGEHLVKILMNEYQVERQRLLIVKNNGSVEEVLEGIIRFVDTMLENKVPVQSISRFILEGGEAK